MNSDIIICKALIVIVTVYVVLSVASAIWMRDPSGWKVFAAIAFEWAVALAILLTVVRRQRSKRDLI